MTNALELFHNRRSRIGRKSLDLGHCSSPDRSSHNHNHNHSNRRPYLHHHHHHQNHNNNNNNTRRDRHDLDGCDPLRRPPLIRHQSHRPSNLEHDAVRLDEGNNFGSIRNISLRSSGNDRLPGDVQLARERLLERLRGVSLSGNRQSNRASSGIDRNDQTFGDDFRLVDAGDWETEISREWLARGTLFTDSVAQTDHLLVPQETSKRPPGLTQEALNCLLLEVFSKAKSGYEGEMLSVSQECGICLESFTEGDELTCLPCAHRFHSSCLDPWVRTCGECPYCRRGIVVN